MEQSITNTMYASYTMVPTFVQLINAPGLIKRLLKWNGNKKDKSNDVWCPGATMKTVDSSTLAPAGRLVDVGNN